jgi:hypothetical protein
MTHTPVPSVTGEGVDMFCLRTCLLPPLTTRFQRTDPSARLTHQSETFAPSATLRNTRSFQTIGVEPDHAGSGSVHASPSVRDQRTGNPVSWLTPFRDGPRHCGQFSAESAEPPSNTINRRGTEPFSTELPRSGTEVTKGYRAGEGVVICYW